MKDRNLTMSDGGEVCKHNTLVTVAQHANIFLMRASSPRADTGSR